jgi:N-acetylmuramoyl-L-alanine amidase
MLTFMRAAAAAAAINLLAPVAVQAATTSDQVLPPEAVLFDPGTDPFATAPADAQPSLHPHERPKTLKDSLPVLVDRHIGVALADAEHECLAGAVYFEAKGEPLEGQLAVADVVLNRTESGRYPASICGVVTQKHQFSFVRGGRIPPANRDSAAWRKAVAVAHIAISNLAEAGVGDAMFFHADYVSPAWSRLTRVASIGNHIFYRR